MDCVILAGGENTRLQEVIPPYHKPLLVVKGETLIKRLVKQVMVSGLCRNIYIITACQNVMAITDLMANLKNNSTVGGNITYVVQPSGTSINEALRIALRVTKSDRILLLCADNYIEEESWDEFIEFVKNRNYVVCGQIIDWEYCDEARRYARFHPNTSLLIEGAKITEDERWFDGKLRCWLGPIMFSRVTAQERIEKWPPHYDRIAALLTDSMTHFFEIESFDIGTEEALHRRG